MAVVAENDTNVLLFDKRKPSTIMETLCHESKVTNIAWSPSEPNMICSVGEGGNAFIWDLYDLGGSPKAADNNRAEGASNKSNQTENKRQPKSEYRQD